MLGLRYWEIVQLLLLYCLLLRLDSRVASLFLFKKTQTLYFTSYSLNIKIFTSKNNLFVLEKKNSNEGKELPSPALKNAAYDADSWTALTQCRHSVGKIGLWIFLFIHPFICQECELDKKIRQLTCKIQPIFLILMTRGDGFIRNGIT